MKARFTLASQILIRGSLVLGLGGVALGLFGATWAETTDTDIPPIWDENGYPLVIGPDRIEEWRPESFFRLFYDGKLGSSHEATGLEDFGYYEQRRAQKKDLGAEKPAQARDKARTEAQPSPAEQSKPRTLSSAFLAGGHVLARIIRRDDNAKALQLTDLQNQTSPASMDLPSAWRDTDLNVLNDAIAHTPSGAWLLSTSPFQLTVLKAGENGESSPRELLIDKPGSMAERAKRFGVLALDDRRALLWAARDRPIPYALALIVDTMNGATLKEIPLSDPAQRWSRVMSIFKGARGGIYFRVDGSGDSLLDPRVALYRLDPETGVKRRLISVPKTSQGLDAWRLIPGRDHKATTIYRDAKSHLLIQRGNAKGEVVKLPLPQPIQKNGISISQDRDQILLLDQSGRLWWLLLEPRLVLIEHGSLAEFESVSGLRLLHDGDFETLNGNDIKRHSSLIPGALARLKPFVSFMEQWELGITDGGFRSLEQAVIGDPDFAARGVGAPHLPWLDLSTVLERVVEQGDVKSVAEFGQTLVNIIGSYADGNHPGKDQALTIYALLARISGHPVLTRLALERLAPSERQRALTWALGQQADAVLKQGLSPAIRRWLVRWINRFPAAFTTAIKNNRAKLLYVLRDFEIPRYPDQSPSWIDFPDLNGQLIRARASSMDANNGQSRIRLLTSE